MRILTYAKTSNDQKKQLERRKGGGGINILISSSELPVSYLIATNAIHVLKFPMRYTTFDLNLMISKIVLLKRTKNYKSTLISKDENNKLISLLPMLCLIAGNMSRLHINITLWNTISPLPVIFLSLLSEIQLVHQCHEDILQCNSICFFT